MAQLLARQTVCFHLPGIQLAPPPLKRLLAGLSVRQGAITLDLSRMHNVTVSPDASNATAQAGALIGQVRRGVRACMPPVHFLASFLKSSSRGQIWQGLHRDGAVMLAGGMVP